MRRGEVCLQIFRRRPDGFPDALRFRKDLRAERKSIGCNPWCEPVTQIFERITLRAREIIECVTPEESKARKEPATDFFGCTAFVFRLVEDSFAYPCHSLGCVETDRTDVFSADVVSETITLI